MRSELRVRLPLQMPQSSAYVTESELLLQAGAPVDQLVYSAPLAALRAAVVLQVCEMYADSLCIYAHFGLPGLAGKCKYGHLDTYSINDDLLDSMNCYCMSTEHRQRHLLAQVWRARRLAPPAARAILPTATHNRHP